MRFGAAMMPAVSLTPVELQSSRKEASAASATPASALHASPAAAVAARVGLPVTPRHAASSASMTRGCVAALKQASARTRGSEGQSRVGWVSE